MLKILLLKRVVEERCLSEKPRNEDLLRLHAYNLFSSGIFIRKVSTLERFL